MDTSLVVSMISGAVALVSAAFSRRSQVAVTHLQARRDREAEAERRKYDQQAREDERRLSARQILDRYRAPLLLAAWELGDGLDNIRHRRFLGLPA
jgi:hypothetical protein